MSAPMDRMDSALAEWLREGPEQGSAEGLDAILAGTRRITQPPAWAFPTRWLPRWFDRDLGGTRAPVAILVLLVVAALIAAVAIAIASQRRLPPPFGFAANGAIAYDTGRGGHAYVADPDGRNARQLPGDGIERQPTYSLDGTRIVYYTRPPDVAGASPDPRGAEFHVMVADADGSNAHPLFGGSTFRLDPFVPPAWSPDSRSIAFRADADGVDQIWVANVDAPAPSAPITTGTATRSAPAWSPDGRWIAYVESRPGNPPVNAVVVARPDGSGRVVLHHQESVGPDEASFGETIRWSPDSRSIAYARGRDPASQEADGPHYVEVVDLDGIERRIYTEPSGWLHFPTWSLDGKVLYFAAGHPSNRILSVDLTSDALAVIGRCAEQIAGPIQLSPSGDLLIDACPGEPRLTAAAGSGGRAGLTLPSDAVRIDIQRLAP